MKLKIIHLLQKYILNPPIKILFAIGIVPPGYALLETVGRKTGKPRRTPVGDGRVGVQFWIVAEHGRKAAYVRNLESNPRVRLKLREGLRGRWYSGKAQVLSEDDPRERQRWLAEQLPGSAGNAAVVRLMGTDLLTVRIDLELQWVLCTERTSTPLGMTRWGRVRIASAPSSSLPQRLKRFHKLPASLISLTA